MGLLSANISILKKRAGITTQQLATRLGVGKTTMSNIESGYVAVPSEKLLSDMARLFSTTVDGLLGNAPLFISDRVRAVYIVASMAGGIPLVQADKITGAVFIDRNKLRGYEHIGITPKDNSMANRRILAGDVVIVRCDCPLKNNDIVAVLIKETEETILRTYFKRGNKIVLKAESDSDFYEDITFNEGDGNFKLVGKVIKCEFEL